MIGLIGKRVGQSGALRRGLQITDIELAPVYDLANGADDAVELDRLELAGSHRLAATFFIALAKLHQLDLHAGNLAVLTEDLNRRAQEAEFNALFLCLFDLVTVGGHFFFAAPIDDIGLFGAETDGRAADVHGDIAAADDSAALADLDLVAEIDFTQKVNTAENTLELFAGDLQFGALLRADGKVEALVALFAQLLDCNILADFDAALELNAHLAQNVDFGVENVLFKAEVRNTERQHTAGDGVAVKDRDGISLVGEIIGAAHTGGAGADDRDFFGKGFAGLVEHLGNKTGGLIKIMVCDKALDFVDGDSLVHIAAGAFLLAALVADTAADSGEGILPLDQLKRLGVLPLGSEL